MEKIIALIDCDSFFASCEQADNHDLFGKPVCVLSKVDDAGIVLARSKEIKQMGIKMCDPYFKIKGKFPNAIFVPARMNLYQETSNKVMEILKDFTPDVEVASIDEAYIDLTGLHKLYKKNYVAICQDIRSAIYSKLKISVSIGLSTSKLLAKLASDQAKLNGGVFKIRPDEISSKIGNLSIDEVSGVGKQHNKKLQLSGIFTINDYINKEDNWIRTVLGATGIQLKHELLGQYISKVDKEPKAPKSIQSSSVLDEFTKDKDKLHNSLNYHIHQACRKLRRWNGYAIEVGVMLKFKNFDVVSKKEKLKQGTNAESDIISVASNLLNQLYNPNILYRSCGISLDNISYGTSQTNLFDVIEYKDDKLSRLIDELEDKFGKNIVKAGFI